MLFPETPDPSSWRFSSRIAAAIIVLGLMAAGLVAGVLFWSTHEADRIALSRQQALARHALAERVAKIPHDQESVSIWDDALHAIGKRDMAWMQVNLGEWMHDYFGHDRSFVLDPEQVPIYAMADGKEAPPARYAGIEETVGPLIADLRRRQTLQGAGDDPLRSVDVLLVEARPAVVSVVPFVSDSGEIVQQPGTEPLYVSVRFLDGSFLQELMRDFLLHDVRFSWRDDAGQQESALPLRSGSGLTIGYFIWNPERPGGRMLAQLLPAVAGGMLLAGALMAFLVLRLRRASLELQASEAHAQHLAFHDALSGLPNRARFADCLEQALATARKERTKFALLWLDLDRFKQVNDVLGHPAGDEVIQEFAKRLTALVRAQDVVARIGGDEFAVLLAGISGAADVEALSARILGEVRAPFTFLGGQASVGVSIGAVLVPEHGVDQAEITRKADIALYRAKSEGRDCLRIFTQQMDSSYMRRQKIERDLREALEADEQLYVVYQPKFSTDGESVKGVEALLRWKHPEFGELSPATFVPIAEESGLIHELGEWVLRRACAEARSWAVTLAVNVSPTQFRSEGFADTVLAIVRETGIAPVRLELEITETVLLDAAHSASETIGRLKAAGIRIALDDFGTGYSSLACLRDFAVDRIKIDQSFVQHLNESPESEMIVRAMVGLARALGVDVTAEGVETSSQHRVLSGFALDEVQGFFFSRPLSRQATAALIEAAATRRLSTPLARAAS